MKEILGVNGVQANIAVYAFLTVALLRYLIIFNQTHERKLIKILVLVFLFWTINFDFYLLSNYPQMLSEPLNDKLNWFEVVSTCLSTLFIFFNIDKKPFCNNSPNCKYFKPEK